jgi:hypothetical protein
MPHRVLCIGVLFFVSLSAPVLVSTRVFALEQSKQQEIERLAIQLEIGTQDDRLDAVNGLSTLGKDAIPPLIHTLRTSKNPKLQGAIAQALGLIGEDAVPPLINVLHDENANKRDIFVLRYGANALKNIAERLKRGFRDAVPELKQILQNRRQLEEGGASANELQDSDAAADCLGYFGKEARDAVPLLIELIPNDNSRNAKDYKKINAVLQILDDLFSYKEFSANKAIIEAFERSKSRLSEQDRIKIENRINSLKTGSDLHDVEVSRTSRGIFVKYPALKRLAVLLSLAALAALVWLALLWLRPLWLLRAYELLPITDAHVSGVLGTVSLPIKYLLAKCMLHPRALDAWVRANLDDAYDEFSKKPTVEEHKIYVPVALFVDGKPITELKPKHLQDTFSRNHSRLMIAGAGGTGKTSLACQIAYWAMREDEDQRLSRTHVMLPVWLEHDFAAKGGEALRDEISNKLCDLIDPKPAVSKILLRALLAEKRILIVVDGMSELTEETRSAILWGLNRIEVNAVVFTSRTNEAVGDLRRTNLKPTNIKGNQLTSFVEAYLTSRGKKELFNDFEFLEGCLLMSRIVGERDITVLIATRFVEHMIAKQEGIIDEDLPTTIPELMMQSIQVLYAKTPCPELSSNKVITAASLIAWECLKENYRPVSAEYDQVEKALAGIPNGEKALSYLKDTLKIIETAKLDQKIGFKIDPLAEYLAGMHLVKENKGRPERWREFLDSAPSDGSSIEAIKGFLIAVRDCCLTDTAQGEVPPFVVAELTDLLSEVGNEGQRHVEGSKQTLS